MMTDTQPTAEEQAPELFFIRACPNCFSTGQYYDAKMGVFYVHCRWCNGAGYLTDHPVAKAAPDMRGGYKPPTFLTQGEGIDNSMWAAGKGQSDYPARSPKPKPPTEARKRGNC
jgi:hypothetical protein